MESDGIPRGICGFTPKNQIMAPSGNEEGWKEITGKVYCTRDPWEEADTDRCVWHADVKGKSHRDLPKSTTEDGARVDGATLRNGRFRHTNCLSGLVLRATDLTGADLDYANLTGANLRQADLTDADLDNATLTDADLDNATLIGGNLHNATLTGADIRHADLTDANLQGTTLADADLRQATLAGADFRDADLTGANLWTVTLTEADLQSVNLTDANLQDADLTDAYLNNATLTGANLHNATLTDADLQQADLTDADLTGAPARGANMEDARLEETNLEHADLGLVALHDAQLHNVPINEGTTFADDQDKQGPYELRADRTTDTRHCQDGPRWAGWIPTPLRRVRNRRHTDPKPLEKAVRTYREIQRLLRENAMSDRAPAFHVRAKHARRKQALAEGDYSGWFRLSLARWGMLYGESPWHVLGWWAVVILAAWPLYAIGGIKPHNGSAQTIGSLAELGTVAGLREALLYLYFSVITFSTIGYGDLSPASGLSRLVVGVESILGALLLALLIFVLGRRVAR